MIQKFKRLVAISIIYKTLAANFIVGYAADTLFPQVGVQTIVQDITEDQARWAYAKELGEMIDPDELRLMSAIIWCEAGNQCEAGQQAVGIVVMNRVDEASFANSVEDVIYETGQFRPKTDGRLNKALGMYDAGTLPNDCIEAAIYALVGHKIVTYNNQEIDMSEYLYFARHWKNSKLTIEDHDFK